MDTQAQCSEDSVVILLVEDNPGDVFLIQEALKEQNVASCWVLFDDSEKALHALRRMAEDPNGDAPGLIVLDLNLPRVSGFDLLSEIRANPRLKKVPVVILTSSRSPDDIRRSTELGADRYIQKPVHLDAFLSEVGGALREIVETRIVNAERGR